MQFHNKHSLASAQTTDSWRSRLISDTGMKMDVKFWCCFTLPHSMMWTGFPWRRASAVIFRQSKPCPQNVLLPSIVCSGDRLRQFVVLVVVAPILVYLVVFDVCLRLEMLRISYENQLCENPLLVKARSGHSGMIHGMISIYKYTRQTTADEGCDSNKNIFTKYFSNFDGWR